MGETKLFFLKAFEKQGDFAAVFRVVFLFQLNGGIVVICGLMAVYRNLPSLYTMFLPAAKRLYTFSKRAASLTIADASQSLLQRDMAVRAGFVPAREDAPPWLAQAARTNSQHASRRPLRI